MRTTHWKWIVVLAGFLTVQAFGQPAAIVSGSNLSLPPLAPLPVPYDASGGHWVFDADLIFDPAAPPMEKHFMSPVFADGNPILLDAEQPFPQPLWENFFLVPGASLPVSDWHEEILTPGWEWVLPGDDRFSGLFPPDESLITMNGDPWPWDHIPMPDPDPTKLWVEFPPIEPSNVLDVHKALLWVGTPGNRTWGDNVDDAGNTTNEQLIRVIEYPTPEPASGLLLALGGLGLLRRRRR